MIFPALETKRLKLRIFTPESYDYIFRQCSGEEQLEIFHGRTEELELEKSRYAKGMVTFNRSFVFFHLFEKKSGTLIGWVGYHTWAFEHFRAEIGYSLNDDAYKQKGYMHEALTAILDYGFNDMKLNRVEALIGPDNIASQNLVLKLGFQFEGNLREHYLKNDKLEDSWAYSLLKREWDAKAG
ncbi:MAG: acetyltransferase, ribosomal protein N-acetylase [Crocinitomicaceae bacterium]|jgi:ribosomal-protein-alanine N-acetyltransferase|nr:acetyltransferase, ribosomal protein N-acetylase [Crocinitomicaceae bacterium]